MNHRGCDTVIIDSLKDVALDLSQDDTGSRVNQALQQTLSAGIEVLVVHHQRKAASGGPKPNHLSDVYGSTWITAGAGSVVLLLGEPGDPLIEVHHLKQPAEPFNRFTMTADPETGALSVVDSVDPLTILRGAPRGLTAHLLATTTTGDDKPGRQDIEKARRKLNRLVDKGLATSRSGTRGGARQGEREPTLYFAADDRREEP